MKKLFFLLVLVNFILVMGCSGEKEVSKAPDSKDSMVSPSEGPLALPAESNPEANKHNEEGIDHWNQGHHDVALKHFNMASKIDGSSGEVHFNEAIAYDKVNQHGEATKHFKVAQQNANGNTLILESKILLAHVQ
jgi:Tfp pilus assembly protein PilF